MPTEATAIPVNAEPHAPEATADADTIMQISKASIAALFVMIKVLKGLNLVPPDSPTAGNARRG